ncbi:putative beta-lactamase [Xylaria sp. FL0064]|nr:putative beta-lactamase [Xylaria sp. FL0064]
MTFIIRNLSITAAILASAVQPLVKATYPRDVLQYGSPESVGMLSQPLTDMVANFTHFTEARNWGAATSNQVVPVKPGGVTLVARNGIIVSHFALGKRSIWAAVNGSTGTMLPPAQREDATIDTVYHMASLTKMYTTVANLRCIDQGLIGLNGTVVTYLPKFGTNGKETITILQLMTHTSGFPADPEVGLWMPEYPTYESRIEQILNETLQNEPGSAYLYSDLNYMTMMLVIEEATGKRLDDIIYEYTSAMGMTDTFFNRGNIEDPEFPFYSRMAAQEFQITVLGEEEPQRPQPVRGTVHDENAWSLNGVSGHAGLFSTVLDTARFCQMILNNGTFGGKRILSTESVDLIFTNFNARFGPSAYHGIGFELDQYYTAGPMANLLSASHTGYTGTSMVIDRASNTLFLHFSNRVHPSRNWSSNNIVRETLGAWVATALGKNVLFPF